MSSIDTREVHTNSTWVDTLRYHRPTGILTIVTDKGAEIQYQVPEWKYDALLERTTTKTNKKGEVSVGSAVNEFIGDNVDFNVKGAQENADAQVALMSPLERQSMWVALCNLPNLFDA